MESGCQVTSVFILFPFGQPMEWHLPTLRDSHPYVAHSDTHDPPPKKNHSYRLPGSVFRSLDDPNLVNSTSEANHHRHSSLL